jgi:hypothetical protein
MLKSQPLHSTTTGGDAEIPASPARISEREASPGVGISRRIRTRLKDRARRGGTADRVSAVARPQAQSSARVVWRRRIAKASRWLHVYVSMASFVVVFFFSVTGLTLNHPDWFASQERTVQYKGTLDPVWTSGSEVARLEIVERLRSNHQIRGAVSDFRVDDGQCSVSFRGPGYTADAFIDRQTGAYELTESRMGFAAVMNDLHKGRDSGPVWKGLIDLSAGLLTLVSLTGLVLLYFLYKQRTAGLLSLAAGATIALAVYAIWVP